MTSLTSAPSPFGLAPTPEKTGLVTQSPTPSTVVSATTRERPKDIDPEWGNLTVVKLRELVAYLFQYWRQGVIGGGIAAAVVFAMLGMGANIYEAEAKLEVRIQEVNLLDVREKSDGLSEQSALQIMNNHRTNLTTRRFIDYLYDKMPEADRASYLDGTDKLGLRKRIFVALHLSAPPPVLTEKDRFAKKLNVQAKVEPVKDSHIIRVAVRDNDAKVAASLASLYAGSYIEFLNDNASTDAREAQERIEAKVTETKHRLAMAQDELASFNREADLLKAGEGGDITQMQAENLGKARADTTVELLKAQQRVRQYRDTLAQGRDIGGVKGLGDDPQMIEIKKKLIEAKSRLDALLEWCGRTHPKLIQTRTEVQRLEDESNSRIQEIVRAAEGEEERLNNEHTQFTKLLSGARAEAFGESASRSRQKQLTDQVEELRLVYTDLLKHQERARLVAELRGNSHLDFIDPAVPPESAVWPVTSLSLLASMMAFGLVGLGVPVGTGLGRDHLLPLLQSFQKPQVKTSLPLPPSAASTAIQQLPPAPKPATGLPRVATPRVEAKAPVLAVIPEVFAPEGMEQLGSLMRGPALPGGYGLMPLMGAMESVRSKRAGIGIILVTSALEHEGKSLVASGLAAAFCSAGKRVLLMDCNTVDPAIERWFAGAQTNSTGSYDLNALRYGQSNLFLLPGHDLPSRDMCDLLDGYRCWIDIAATHQLDWVIMDGAALMRHFADVAQLALLATDVIMVQDQRSTQPAQVRAAFNLLTPVCGPQVLRGVVANRGR